MQPQFANIATASEWSSRLVTLEIGEATGTIHFCIPYATSSRSATSSTRRAGRLERARRRWVTHDAAIQSAEVELVAELAQPPATVEQLLALKAGDFIELDLHQAIQAKLAGVPVLDCHYGTSNGKYALKVDQLLAGSREGWLGENNVH